MDITFNPYRIDGLHYKIEDEVVYFKHFDRVMRLNFIGLPDGIMLNTDLDDFILFAEKQNSKLALVIRQPVDNMGMPLEIDSNFDINEYEDIEIIWKTKEEIESEKNKPKDPTQEEIILQKVIDLLPASVIAEGIEEQYQSALAELNLESEE